MRRGTIRGFAAALACAAAFAPAGAHGAPLDRHSCAWLFRLSGDQVNAAFPDSAARYWVAQIPIPPGYHADLIGQFPHARYISFIDYDAASRAIDGIADDQIVPDPGSTNPFVALADRTATQRAYVVHVRNEVMPAAGREPNTIYTETPAEQTKTSRPTDTALVVYRVYEPDHAFAGDITGGVGLPAVSLVADDGSGSQPIPDCDDRSLPDLGLTGQLAGAGREPATTASRRPSSARATRRSGSATPTRSTASPTACSTTTARAMPPSPCSTRRTPSRAAGSTRTSTTRT